MLITELVQFYFALLIYSYATHLRKGSYRSLHHSRSNGSAVPSSYEASALPDEDEEIEDFYRVPIRTPQSGSISSFTEFMAAPKRPRRTKGGKSSMSRVINAPNGAGNEDVLFDDEDRSEEGSARSGGENNTREEERALVGDGKGRSLV